MKITTWRPYPICVLGYDVRRWEFDGQRDVTFQSFVKKLIAWQWTQNCGPTHLQYDSPFGFLITWPLCFHLWVRFRPQQTKIGDGGVVLKVPGSETVLQISIGVARWDANDRCYMVPRFYIGGHYD